MKAGVSSAADRLKSVASFSESHSSAFRGTKTRMVVRVRRDAGYWKSMDLPKPVGRLAKTWWRWLQLMMASCMGLRRIPLKVTSWLTSLHSLTFPIFIIMLSRLRGRQKYTASIAATMPSMLTSQIKFYLAPYWRRADQ